MTIVCGTDLSESAASATRVAAIIAQRLGAPLRLVHAVDVPTADPKRGAQDTRELEKRLQEASERLRTELAIDVEPLLRTGPPDDTLVELARDLGARLVVVAALGPRRQHRWLLGSVAERVAQSSSVPVLIVRDGSSIERWARGEGPLRVMVAVEHTPESRAALRWAEGLRAIGPCQLHVTQIVWPAETRRPIGVSSPMPLDHLPPELEQSLRDDLRRWAGASQDSSDTLFVVKPGWGRVDGHLAQLASESRMDLLVVGTHHRAAIARLWQGSVSRNVLHGASMNVACVPQP